MNANAYLRKCRRRWAVWVALSIWGAVVGTTEIRTLASACALSRRLNSETSVNIILNLACEHAQPRMSAHRNIEALHGGPALLTPLSAHHVST